MNIPPDYAQANLKFTGNAVPNGAEITLGLNVELFVGTPSDAADLVATNWNASAIDTLQVTEIALTEVLVKYGPNATGPSGFWTGSIAGGTGSAATPPNTAMLVQKVTGFGGRTGRGRFYIPGMSEGQIDSKGDWSTTWVNDGQTAMDAFYAAMVADALIPTLLHGPDSPVTTPIPITSFSVQPRAATQRRRLRR